MIKFLHTGDWQLGMTRYFFSEGAQERYSQARFDAIRAMGSIAKEKGCRFMLVCGDAFESNQVDRKTVARAMEALKEVSVPVFMLPGNHDPLNDASVYRSDMFLERKPEHVRVIEDAIPLKLDGETEIVGAPWTSKRPFVNPVEAALASLQPTAGVTRICAAHGIVDYFTPDRDAQGVIAVEMLERAVSEGRVHFVALGDRHSLTGVGKSGRIWYSGTPESTDFSETQSGYANIVEIDGGQVFTEAVRIGQWQFVEWERIDLNTFEEVEAFKRSLEGIGNKERTVARMNCVGSLSLSLREELQKILDTAVDVFAALDVREDGLLVLPDDADFRDLGFSGFADNTVKRLRKQITGEGAAGTEARDALMLLMRLARGAA